LAADKQGTRDVPILARHAERRVRDAMLDTRIVAITGPRQSGKTTLVKTITDDDRPYLTLDDPATLAAARADPAGFIRRLETAVIDEFQRAPELALPLKQSVDEDQRPGRFLITGSADLLAMPKATESLAGRIEIIPLFPLSQAEISGRGPSSLIEQAFDGALVAPASTQVHLVQRLLTGGYPAALARSSERRRREWHRAYLTSLLSRDLRDLSDATRLERMPQLFELLATRAGQLINWSTLSNDIKLDGKTVDRYVHLLETLFLVRRLPAWSRNQTQRLVSTPKLHFLDSGLLATTAGITEERVSLDRSPLGPVLETHVFAELTKAVALSERNVSLSHYRDKDQVEVDFVIEENRHALIGIEVKAAATVRESDFAGLRRLAHRVGEDFRSGIVLYDGERILPFGDRLFAVPLAGL
jgi:uncharacterized protein